MSRFSDIDREFKPVSPIFGFRQQKLISIEEALQPIQSQIDNLSDHVKTAKDHCHFPNEHGLSKDQSASIYIYTMEWNKTSLYHVLNQALRSENPSAVKIWFSYLRLFDSALDLLPITLNEIVWRGVPLDIGQSFIHNQKFTWWTVNSCSLRNDVIQRFIKNAEKSTVFLMEIMNGRIVSGYTAYEYEEEIILRSGTRFQVKENPVKGYDGSYTVHLTEIDEDIIEDDKRLHTFGLVWLYPNLTKGKKAEEKLVSIFNHVNKFQNVEQCQQFIETSVKSRLILIVTGQLGRKIVPNIHLMSKIISIYVFCMNKEENEKWASNYSKIKGIFTNSDELNSKINADYQILKIIDEQLPIDIFFPDKQSNNEFNTKFIFSQTLLDCLLKLKFSIDDKHELIRLLKHQYKQNSYELNQIQECQTTYRSNKVLQWYTKECFFYKILNYVLSTENIYWTFLCRSIITDIQKQLQLNQCKQIQKVYRTQIVSQDYLNSLKKSVNQFISINSFVSTTTNYSKAIYLFDHAESLETTEKILFVIKADPNSAAPAKPFAHIADEEVLFMVGSIFYVENMTFNSKNQLSTVEMTLVSDDDKQLEQIHSYKRLKIAQEQMNVQILADILGDMERNDLAEKCLHRLLIDLPSDDPLTGELCDELGKLAAEHRDFDKKTIWDRISIEFKSNKTTPSTPEIIVHQEQTGLKWKQNATTIAGANGEGEQLNQFHWPEGIYVDDDQQHIYIADNKNHRIIKWRFGDDTGEIIAGGNKKGNRIDQLSYPTDVIVDTRTNSLIICDYGNERVVRWPLDDDRNPEIMYSDINCYGLMMNTNGDLYVSDWRKNEVKRWRNGEREGTVVAGGNGKGNRCDQFNQSTNIFVDRNETIYVADRYNHRVMKWEKDAKEGVVIAGGQKRGNSLKQLDQPHGVIVDDLGNVYVADCGNDRIMCWPPGSNEGRPVAGGNGTGHESNQFKNPKGLSFDHKNNLYVVDCWNYRIQKFDLIQDG